MNLVLIPTRFEFDRLDSLAKLVQQRGWAMEVCGFGPIAAAACTAKRIAELRPEQVILVGLAGSLDEQLKIGSAYEFSEVVCYGVGIGSGSEFQGLERLQWLQDGDGQGIPRGDAIALGGEEDRQLLTCCAGSADFNEAATKRQAFPKATAEEMEGFGVALACGMHGVPLRVVRGISNHAGDRHKNRWQIAPALQAAGYLASQIMESASGVH